MIARLLQSLRYRLGLPAPDALGRIDSHLRKVGHKLDRLNKNIEDNRLLIRRAHYLLGRMNLSPPDGLDPPTDVAALPDAVLDDWLYLSACPFCGHRTHSPVCEFNRFLLRPDAPGGESERYDYALCHACGVTFATRRPTGTRFRQLLGKFSESLGRAPTRNLILNPNPLTTADRRELRRRAGAGVFVSEHHQLERSEWIPGALADRMANAVHVEILGSLLDLRGARTLEIRPRTGAISAALRRLFQVEAHVLPMFESQQALARELYDLSGDALIDFDHFRLPDSGPFDLVISNHMLTHAVRPGEFLDVVSGALKPGGHLYLLNEPDDAEFLEHPRWMFSVLNPFHLQTFSPSALVRALGSRGFEPLFVSHTQMNVLCLARKGEAHIEPLTPEALVARLTAYRRARDLAILRLPDEHRARFDAEWPALVERAVAEGTADLDDRGRLVFGQRLARMREHAE